MVITCSVIRVPCKYGNMPPKFLMEKLNCKTLNYLLETRERRNGMRNCEGVNRGVMSDCKKIKVVK